MTTQTLAVVMPVYNESEIIIQVIEDWVKTLDSLSIITKKGCKYFVLQPF